MTLRLLLGIAAWISFSLFAGQASEAQSLKPNWSPDGESLIFYKRQPPNMLIKSIRLSDGKISDISNDSVWLHSPKYSIDGTKAYASGEVDGAPGMFEITLASGKVRRLADIKTRVMHPTPSPDGKWLAFDVALPDNNFDLYLLNLETGDTRQLVDTPEAEFHPSWSPDGSKILLDQRNGDNRHVISVDVASGAIKSLDVSGGDKGMNHPVYGPAGKAVYLAQKDGIFQINGGHKTRLFKPMDGWGVTAPALSPDGKQLAFTVMTNDFSRGRIMVMNTDGTGTEILHDDGE